MDSCDEMFVRNNIEVKVRARNISLQSEVGNSVAKMLLLIMILPANDRSEKDGAIPMGLYPIAACREKFFSERKGRILDGEKLLRYSIQLSMLKQLLYKKLITESEYKMVEKKLKKDYGVVSDITT